MEKVVIDRGLKEYSIEDKNGNVLGTFEINPADPGIERRYKEVVNDLNHLTDIISDDMPQDEAFEKMEDFICQKLDYLFGNAISKNFFSIISPFSVLANGDFYFENVFSVIGALVEQETGERYEKLATKIDDYTKKYHK